MWFLNNNNLVKEICERACPLDIKICETVQHTYCAVYNLCLAIAKTKDKEYISRDFVLEVLRINSNIRDRSCPSAIAYKISQELKKENDE